MATQIIKRTVGGKKRSFSRTGKLTKDFTTKLEILCVRETFQVLCLVLLDLKECEKKTRENTDLC